MATPDEFAALLDALSTVAAWAVGELVKRIARGRPWEETARRAIPPLSVGVGAGVRIALEAAVAGADPRTVIWRGLGAGAVAIAAQNFRTATLEGNVGVAPAPDK